MRHHALIISLLILITSAVYCRAAFCGFVNHDDPTYVGDNPHVLGGLTLENIAWAFTTTTTGYSHPLTWLSLMLDTSVWGAGPWGYHVTNIALHALAAALLYLALDSLTAAPLRSALVALLFAIHPLRVESVAWISERKDVLSGCLAFATLLAYGAYAHRPNWRRYVLVMVFFIMGLLAKPMLITLPFLLLLLDVWPLHRVNGLKLPEPSSRAAACPSRSAGALVLEKIPLLVFAIADGIMAYLLNDPGHGSMASGNAVPASIRLASIPIAYLRYLVKMVWFKNLTFYLYQSWPAWQVLGAVALLCLVTTWVVLCFRTKPWLAVGWFWYVGMLIPVIGIFYVGRQYMADRYTYLPTIGLLIMLVWSLPGRWMQISWARLAAGSVTLAVTFILAVFTWHQIGYWQDTVTLLKHFVDNDPPSELPVMDLGVALDRERHQPVQAVVYLQKAVEMAPRSALAHFNLGVVQMHLGDVRQAMLNFQKAAQFNPSNPAYRLMVAQIQGATQPRNQPSPSAPPALATDRNITH